MHQESYPPLYTKNIPADLWYRNYIQTYIEHDVRNITNIGNLNTFQTFIQLCAGRVGQLLNLTSLANADPSEGFLIYAGSENQKRSTCTVVDWQSIDTIMSSQT